VSRPVWRIATDTPSYEADDLSGAGAKATGGRWNSPGVPVVYASQTRALAYLETVVHLGAGGLPLNRTLVQLAIPDSIWAGARAETSASLPVGWDAEPAGRASIASGSAWIYASSSTLLIVPSVIVPEEFNVLINPRQRANQRREAAEMALRSKAGKVGLRGRCHRNLRITAVPVREIAGARVSIQPAALPSSTVVILADQIS
jgi:RES domain-containing protein